MSEKLKTAYPILFGFLFVLPLAFFLLIGRNTEQVNTENREMAEMPSLTAETITDFPEGFDTYFNDHLPMRTQVLSMGARVKYKVLRKTAVDYVLVGKEDWLFYDSDNCIDQYQGALGYTENDLAAMAENLMRVRDDLSAQGCELVIAITANKESVYGERYLTDDYERNPGQTWGERMVNYLQSNTDLNVVDESAAIRDAMMEGDTEYYYRHDTHWNQLGAYLGTADLLEAMGLPVPALGDLEVVSYQMDSPGDLAQMGGLSDVLPFETGYRIEGYPNNEFVKEGANKTQEFRSHGTGSDPRKVYFVRDSFFTAAGDLICSRFDEIYSPHWDYLTSGNGERVADEAPDVVVLMTAERYALDRLSSISLQ